jgi:hypothetical protein
MEYFLESLIPVVLLAAVVLFVLVNCPGVDAHA